MRNAVPAWLRAKRRNLRPFELRPPLLSQSRKWIVTLFRLILVTFGDATGAAASAIFLFDHNINCRRCGAARQSGLNMPGVYRGRAIAYNPSQPAIKSFTSPPAPASFRVKPPAGYPGILPVGPHNSTAGQRIGTRQNGGGSVRTNVVGLRQLTNTSLYGSSS